MDSFVIGVVAGVVASVLFACLLQTLRPRLKLSPSITRTATRDPDSDFRYRVKVVNRARRPAVDVQMRAFLVRDQWVPSETEGEAGIVRVKTPVDLRRAGGGVIKPYRRRDKEAAYAHRVRFEQSAVAVLQDPSQAKYLVLEISARDGVSGLPRLFTQEYRLETQIKSGTFYHGKSLKVAPPASAAQVYRDHKGDLDENAENPIVRPENED